MEKKSKPWTWHLPDTLGAGRERGWEERKWLGWDGPLSVLEQQAEDRRGRSAFLGKFHAFLPRGWYKWAG